ncbi:hypothetical protein [Candidatus Parabeggiatoa sp. HSG14]|uniref:hypothetical protein n=1 Tax=Candidatus Parabeggiatoa sp. HSG14 TaxID=3055593 RepID=UPI0025A6EBCC|nr:hypothetical protein [Thiotrichales bacterium HSG14]
MTPFILHILFLSLFFIPTLVSGLFYIHYRFFLKDHLKEAISDKHPISMRRVQKKGKVFEDRERIPSKEAVGLLFLLGFVTFTISWITHLFITSISFYFFPQTYSNVLLAHFLSLFSLTVLNYIKRQKS